MTASNIMIPQCHNSYVIFFTNLRVNWPKSLGLSQNGFTMFFQCGWNIILHRSLPLKRRHNFLDQLTGRLPLFIQISITISLCVLIVINIGNYGKNIQNTTVNAPVCKYETCT